MPYTKVHYGTNLINNILLVIIFCIVQLNMQSKTEYISFLKKSENEKNEIGMIQLLNLGIKHLCIIYNGDLKIKIEKNNFCLFLTE